MCLYQVKKFFICSSMILILFMTSKKVYATFSIIAFDPEVKEWGIAVASREIAVGYGVPWARANAGAVVTQALINPLFGRDGLMMMQAGFTAEQTLKALLTRDKSLEKRQIALIDTKGNVAAFSGNKIGLYAGDFQSKYLSVQGNCLTGEIVLSEMVKAFERTEGPLALRLIEALRAGDTAGGDRRGRQSAALLVVRQEGDIRHITDKMIDLRVDNDPNAVEGLANAFEQWAYQITLYFYLTSEVQEENKRSLKLLDWLICRQENRLKPDVGIYCTIAKDLASTKRYPKRAIDLALKAYELRPTNINIMDIVAEAYFSDGNIKKAEEWIIKALNIESENEHLKKQLKRFKK